MVVCVSGSNRKRGSNRGQSLVEFALVAPLFLLLLFVIAESALYVNAVATIDNAAREGVRVAEICGTATGVDCTGAVDQAVVNHMGILPYRTPATTPQISYSQASSQATPVTVTVTYSYNYYLDVFIGQGPTQSVISTATAVAQQ